jgi:hypothetical protein
MPCLQFIVCSFTASEKVPMVLLPTFYFVAELCLAVWLYKCVTQVNLITLCPSHTRLNVCLLLHFLQKNYKRCKIWYIITVTVCLTGFYFFIPGVIFTEESYYFVSIFIASYLFTCYSVWVVHSFMKELKAEGLHKPIIQYEDEMDKF